MLDIIKFEVEVCSTRAPSGRGESTGDAGCEWRCAGRSVGLPGGATLAAPAP
jgi:hypothetical protein